MDKLFLSKDTNVWLNNSRVAVVSKCEVDIAPRAKADRASVYRLAVMEETVVMHEDVTGAPSNFAYFMVSENIKCTPKDRQKLLAYSYEIQMYL